MALYRIARDMAQYRPKHFKGRADNQTRRFQAAGNFAIRPDPDNPGAVRRVPLLWLPNDPDAEARIVDRARREANATPARRVARARRYARAQDNYARARLGQ